MGLYSVRQETSSTRKACTTVIGQVIGVAEKTHRQTEHKQSSQDKDHSQEDCHDIPLTARQPIHSMFSVLCIMRGPSSLHLLVSPAPIVPIEWCSAPTCPVVIPS